MNDVLLLGLAEFVLHFLGAPFLFFFILLFLVLFLLLVFIATKPAPTSFSLAAFALFLVFGLLV